MLIVFPIDIIFDLSAIPYYIIQKLPANPETEGWAGSFSLA